MNKTVIALMVFFGSAQFIFAESPSPVPKTGQTISYRTGDDGDLETGVTLPNPRFTDYGDGTVRDHLTGLEWVQAPQSLYGNSNTKAWNSAVDFCNNLVYAGHSDWRLPSVKELESLVDGGRSSLALPIGHPFSGVQGFYGQYWSSTSTVNNPTYAWCVEMAYGSVFQEIKTYSFVDYAWPVRGGQ